MSHNLAFIGIAQYGSQWLAECECHDPDSDWHGRRDYYGTSYTDVYDQWLDHHNESCICTSAIAGISDGPNVDCPIHGDV